MVNGNTGCPVVFPDKLSFGPSFNDNGGGWCVIYNEQFPPCLQLCFFSIFRYALERTCTDINIWFWPRSSYFVPLEVQWGLDIVDPESWVCENLFLTCL